MISSYLKAISPFQYTSNSLPVPCFAFRYRHVRHDSLHVSSFENTLFTSLQPKTAITPIHHCETQGSFQALNAPRKIGFVSASAAYLAREVAHGLVILIGKRDFRSINVALGMVQLGSSCATTISLVCAITFLVSPSSYHRTVRKQHTTTRTIHC